MLIKKYALNKHVCLLTRLYGMVAILCLIKSYSLYLDQKVEEVLMTVDDKTFGMISILSICSCHLFYTTAEIGDWNVVMKECKSLAAKWKELSISLGLSCDVINNIKGSGENYHCLSEALEHWIKQNYNTETFDQPSWRSLLKAVAEIDKLLFKRLAAKHSQPGMCMCEVVVLIIIFCNTCSFQ